MELKQLRALVLIARKSKLSHAAKALKLTPSGVSLRLKRLESELHINLFERRPNKLLLTEGGQAFAQSVSVALEALDNAIATVRQQHHDTQKTVSIALGGDTAFALGPRLAAFAKKTALRTFTILTRSPSEIIDSVLDDRVDLGIGRFQKLPPQLQAVDLHLPHTLLAVSQKDVRDLGPRRLSVRQLADHPLIVLPQHSATRRVVDETFHRFDLEMKLSMEASGCLAIKRFAKLGLGVGLVHDICLFKAERTEFDIRDLSHLFGYWQTKLIFKKSRPLSSVHQDLIKAISRPTQLV